MLAVQKQLYCTGKTVLRILTGKNTLKTPALTKNRNIDIWVVGTSN